MAKYKTVKDLPDCLTDLSDSKREQDRATQFGNLKTKGVGQTTILKFLGKTWKQWMIQAALQILKDKELDSPIYTAFKASDACCAAFSRMSRYFATNSNFSPIVAHPNVNTVF